MNYKKLIIRNIQEALKIVKGADEITYEKIIISDTLDFPLECYLSKQYFNGKKILRLDFSDNEEDDIDLLAYNQEVDLPYEIEAQEVYEIILRELKNIQKEFLEYIKNFDTTISFIEQITEELKDSK